MVKDQNRSDRSLHIAPLSYPKTAKCMGKTEKIKEKFGSFKKNMEEVMRKRGGKSVKKEKNDINFVVKNRKRLVSSCFVARIIFFAWKNHVFNRKRV